MPLPRFFRSFPTLRAAAALLGVMALMPMATAQEGRAAPAGAGGNAVSFSALKAAAQVDLGEVTFTFSGIASSHSRNVGAQLYIQRLSPDPAWVFVNGTGGDGSAKVFPLYHGLSGQISFTAELPPGVYDGYRLLLFDASGGGINYGDMVYDTGKDMSPAKRATRLAFRVTSSQTRLRAPQLSYAPQPASVATGDASLPAAQQQYTVTVPAKLQLPQDYVVQGGGFWVMAKGSGGFSQAWVPQSSFVAGGTPEAPDQEAPVTFTLPGLKPGLYNVQFGVFKSDWGNPLQWVYPGLDFEAGGDAWVVKSTRMPPRLRYENHRFVHNGAPAPLYPDDPSALRAVRFVRGGNYGNALDRLVQPALDDPAYFALLGEIGCRFVRTLFDPDRFLADPLYRHAVDQVVQNIWQSGAYPLIAPQDLPEAPSLSERVQRGEQVCRMMAEIYKGQSVWIELVNEPHEFDTWAQWKPVAEQYAKSVRAVDPDAFVVAPFESWSKDGRAAAASPITSVPIDLYDGHAYVAPKDVQSLFGPAAAAGLPVLIGEYGGGAAYLSEMDHALQTLTPAPVAVAPWAFTVHGEDSLPLVQSVQGASIQYTPAGEAIERAYTAWLAGRKVQ